MASLTRKDVLAIFSNLSSENASERTSFFDHVLDNVNWTIMGHSPMSKTYTSKYDFINATLQVLGNQVLKGPLRMYAYNAIVAAPSEDGSQQAVVEMRALDAECRNGMTYDMTYCWVCTFIDVEGERRIAKVRAYVDSDLLTRAIKENTEPGDDGFGKTGVLHHE